MRYVYIDTETYSETPIRDGTYAYAADAEVMLFAYAIDDQDVIVLDCTNGDKIPTYEELTDNKPTTFVMHNSMFDRNVLRLSAGLDIPTSELWDTMVQAYAHSLPGSLDLLGEIFKLDGDEAKDKTGKKLIQLFCKPRPKNHKLHRATGETHPEEWAQFIHYAAQDIVAMRVLKDKLPTENYPGLEHELWVLDQKINDRGFEVDTTLAEGAIKAIDKAQEDLADRVNDLTDGAVSKATQRDAMLKHILGEHGVALPDLQKATLERRAYDPQLPSIVRELLQIRLQASKSSTSKYESLIKATSTDGRLRGTLQFCGAARTGRWSGRTFQPQNLFRPTMKQDVIEAGIDAIKNNIAHHVTDDVMDLAANALRGCIIAPEGKKLVVTDLSNIEGRFAAWVADEIEM